MSAYGMQRNGHIRMTDATFVKSSKIRTIVPCDRDAKLHVIMQLLPMSIGKYACKWQATSGSRT